MSITSFTFLGFVLVTLLLYQFIPAKYRWWLLLAASVVFYVSFSVAGIFVMIATALLTWLAGLQVQKRKDEHAAWLAENKKTADKETRKAKKAYYQKKQQLYVAVTVGVILFILFLCKYYKVLARDVNGLLDTRLWTAENMLLPLGISYYSLQLIGYLTDVNRDIIAAEKNPLKVILYGGFFLSIMQGPFHRYNDVMPQLCSQERKQLTYTHYKFAVLKIAGGYIKKLCIADQVGVIAHEVFANADRYRGLGIALGIVCFALQLYTDFSGYMDIIIGIGQLFGIEMPENFRQPFFSRNISEFWQKWHITLGLWLKDYVFYPVLKSKAFKELGKGLSDKVGKEAARRIPTYLGMLILWTLIGTWHGAGFHYIFSVGLLQFLYIFLGELCEPLFAGARKLLHIREDRLYWHIFQSLRTTALMMFAWIFFQSPSFGAALHMIRRLLVVPKWGQILKVLASQSVEEYRYLLFIAVCMAAVIAVDLLHEKGQSLRTLVCSKPYPIRLLFYLLLVFTILIFGAYGDRYVSSNFIYFEF